MSVGDFRWPPDTYEVICNKSYLLLYNIICRLIFFFYFSTNETLQSVLDSGVFQGVTLKGRKPAMAYKEQLLSTLIKCVTDWFTSVRGLPFHNQGGVRVFTPEYNFFFLSEWKYNFFFFQNESTIFFYYQSVHCFII